MSPEHPYDDLMGWLYWVSGYDIALGFDSYFIGRVKHNMPTFRDGGIVGYFYSYPESQEYIYENEELFTWFATSDYCSVSLPTCLISLQGDEILVSWINGTSNLFKKNSTTSSNDVTEEIFECDKPLYTPDLRICKNAKIWCKNFRYENNERIRRL